MHTLFVNWLDTLAIKAIGWTLIHSLWQGIIVAAIAGACIMYTRRSSAMLRYNLLTGVFLLFVCIVAGTLIWQWNIAADHVIELQITPINPIIKQTASLVAAENYSQPWILKEWIAYFDKHATEIVFIWGLVVMIHFIKMLFGFRYIHRIRNQQVFPVSQELTEALEALKEKLHIRQKIGLLQSGIVKVPAMVGITKPLILLPIALLNNLPYSCVESILLHELAHVRRKDYLVNMLQSVMEMIFFFNPALLWISARMREEREACCDDIVLAHGGDKTKYLESLVYFQEEIPVNGYAMALQTKKHYLLTRVRRMLTHENNKLTTMERNLLAIGLISLSAMAFIPQKEKSSISQALTSVISARSADTLNPPPKVIEVSELNPMAEATLVNIDAVPDKSSELIPVKDLVPLQENIFIDAVLDTIPGGKNETINSTTTVNTDDNGKETYESRIASDDGNTYRVKKVDGKITEFQVNGKDVPQSEFGKYKSFFADLEKREKENKVRRLQMDQQRQLMDERRKVMDQERLAMEKRRVVLEDQRKVLEERRTEMEQHRKVMEEKRRDMEQHSREIKEKLKRDKSTSSCAQGGTGNIVKHSHEAVEHTHEACRGNHTHPECIDKGKNLNQNINEIVEELTELNIVKAGSPVTFKLTETELLVNGNRQDVALQTKLKERYNINKGKFYEYKNDGNGGVTSRVAVNN